MRHIAFIFLLISTSCLAIAQKKAHYSGSIEGGITKGSNPVNGFLFTTQGIAYNQYTLSIGSGLDFYSFRSIPLFVDLKRSFGNNAVEPFVQAAAGVNFTSSNSKDVKMIYQFSQGGHFDNGFFAKAGAGIIFRAQKKLRILLLGGYNYKTFSYKYQPFTGTPWMWQVVPVKDVYNFNRWYFGAGISW
jgi:hypothetical protein